jgi:hypothetical protein
MITWGWIRSGTEYQGVHAFRHSIIYVGRNMLKRTEMKSACTMSLSILSDSCHIGKKKKKKKREEKFKWESENESTREHCIYSQFNCFQAGVTLRQVIKIIVQITKSHNHPKNYYLASKIGVRTTKKSWCLIKRHVCVHWVYKIADHVLVRIVPKTFRTFCFGDNAHRKKG